MTVRKRGDNYVADFMVTGQRYRRPFPTKAEAEAWELEARAALKRGQPVPEAQNGRAESGGSLHTLGALFDYTVKMHWRNNPRITSPETAIRAARGAVDFFGRNQLVAEITTDEMKRYQRSVVESGRTYTTADRRLAALSKMMRFAEEKGVIPKVPKVPLSGQTNERYRFLTKAEAQRMLALWREWDQPDMHAFTTVALHTGARLNALLTLSWQDFSPNLETVFFKGGKWDKGSLPRTLPLSKAAKEAILDMKRRYPDQAGPFRHMKSDGAMRRKWKLMQEQLGYDDVVIHTLRHTCASWLVQAGVDIMRVKKWLGHKRIETTLIYAKLAPGDLDALTDVLGGQLEPDRPTLRVVGEDH